jgi:protein SCO1/2
MNQVFLVLVSMIFLAGGCAKPLPILAELPDFSFQDQRGYPIGKKDLEGKVWVANFIYTGCGEVCPMLTQKMKELQGAFGNFSKNEELRFVSFTVDPENDTPQRLAHYAEAFGADGKKWHFLTGPMEEIEKTIVEGFRVSARKLSAFEIVHGDRFVLVDRQGRIRGYYEADKKGLHQLSRGILQLAGESFSRIQ